MTCAASMARFWYRLMVLLQHLGKGAGLHHVLSARWS